MKRHPHHIKSSKTRARARTKARAKVAMAGGGIKGTLAIRVVAGAGPKEAGSDHAILASKESPQYHDILSISYNDS